MYIYFMYMYHIKIDVLEGRLFYPIAQPAQS